MSGSTVEISVNMLIEWDQDGSAPRVERVLWIDSGRTEMALIDVFAKNALPVLQPYRSITDAIYLGAARILEIDPYRALYQREKDITLKNQLRRNRAWESIAALVENPSREIFIRKERGARIAAAAKGVGCTRKTIYKRLRRYWQGGQTKNALLPRYDKCGGRGKEKLSEHPTNTVKRGRASALSLQRNEVTGVNITEEHRDRLVQGARLFHEKQGLSLRKAYDLTLQRFFNIGHKFDGEIVVPVLPPAEERPSFAQFRYWYEKARDPARAIASRRGQSHYESNSSPILGDSRSMASGPGSLYQIDSTPADIELVSSLNRGWVVGRPTLYMVVDVFSRLVTGLSISLEYESWMTAMLAFENTTTEKVAFCRSYNISIDTADWPSHHLPECLLADRGAYEGYNADNLTMGLNVNVDNTAPYRGDQKGIVERIFRTAREGIISGLPGATQPLRTRGPKKQTPDPCLTIFEFTQIMINYVLKYNLSHRLENYIMDADMIADGVRPYPINLWQWGIENRAGHLRTMDPNIIRLNLLPRGSATASRQGLRFQGFYYTCPTAEEQGWFIRQKGRRWKKTDVVYDPRLVDMIYIRTEDGKGMEPCTLLPKYRAFKGHTWDEVKDRRKRRRADRQISETARLEKEANVTARTGHVVSKAQEETAKATAGMSKTARKRGKREHRKGERDMLRRDSAWHLESDPTDDGLNEQIPALTGEGEGQYLPPPKELDAIRRVRNELLEVKEDDQD